MTTRRRFLENATRLLLLGGLCAGVAHMAARKGTPKEPACGGKKRDCRDCPALSYCTLPEALRAKESES